MGDTRSLDRARGRIERVASELDVPAPTEQMAQQLLDTVHEELDTDGRRMDVLGAAALSLSCKHQKLPVTPEMVSQTWGAETDDAYGDFETKLLHRRLETVRDATGLNPPPTEPTELVEGYRESLGVPEQVTESTREILEQLMVVAPEEVTGGTSPSGNAAGALYIAVCELGLRQGYTQSDIADAGGVTEVTIRKRYQRIAEAGAIDRECREGTERGPCLVLDSLDTPHPSGVLLSTRPVGYPLGHDSFEIGSANG